MRRSSLWNLEGGNSPRALFEMFSIIFYPHRISSFHWKLEFKRVSSIIIVSYFYISCRHRTIRDPKLVSQQSTSESIRSCIYLNWVTTNPGDVAMHVFYKKVELVDHLLCNTVFWEVIDRCVSSVSNYECLTHPSRMKASKDSKIQRLTIRLKISFRRAYFLRRLSFA